MCYEPGYAHLSRAEKQAERARIQDHHLKLRQAVQDGEPGAQDAYDRHLDQHRNASFENHSFREADERAKSILMQRAAEKRVFARKEARREAINAQGIGKAARREAKRARRAARRRQREQAAAFVFGGTIISQAFPIRELVTA